MNTPTFKQVQELSLELGRTQALAEAAESLVAEKDKALVAIQQIHASTDGGAVIMEGRRGMISDKLRYALALTPAGMVSELARLREIEKLTMSEIDKLTAEKTSQYRTAYCNAEQRAKRLADALRDVLAAADDKEGADAFDKAQAALADQPDTGMGSKLAELARLREVVGVRGDCATGESDYAHWGKLCDAYDEAKRLRPRIAERDAELQRLKRELLHSREVTKIAVRLKLAAQAQRDTLIAAGDKIRNHKTRTDAAFAEWDAAKQGAQPVEVERIRALVAEWLTHDVADARAVEIVKAVAEWCGVEVPILSPDEKASDLAAIRAAIDAARKSGGAL